MKKDETHAGFRVIDVAEVDELGARGVWLRHEVTGMEVYHLVNNDEENLFGFAFKTPPSDSTGVAHILEHSVLCGSKSFPLKDPFLQLSNQSVKTFLNAMTFPDKTVYPASSMVEADYFNLMDVYGDAVFFPLLEEWTFKQEAHRLERAADGSVSLQGVVYNEMKGNYSSAESVAAEWALRSLLPGTVYEWDSGGDPAHIPDLTYEQFKKFHAAYYHPANCRLFLCGSIATEKQLAFIEERFLRHFGKPDGSVAPAIGFAKPFSTPVKLAVPAPAVNEDGSSGSAVLVNWLLGDAADPLQAMEANFLCEILLGHDGSPLSRALIESGLGEDISPNSGLETEIRQLCLSAGLRGVDRKKADDVEKLIFGVLAEVAQNGVPEEEIQAACMSIDFATREVRRSGGGPFSLSLMRRALKGWLHGLRPDLVFHSRKTFAAVKKRAENPAYVKELCRRLLLENTHRSLLVVYPDKEYESRCAATEQKLIQRLLAATVPENAAELLKKQSEPESPEKLALIPHLKPQDLSDKIDKIDTRPAHIGSVPVFTLEENTNGIVYVEAGLPVDVLAPEDFPLLPLFSSAITSMGFNGMDWVQASAYQARLCGGFGSSLFTSSYADEADPGRGRSWLFFRVKMLEENCEAAIRMLFDCLTGADFSDTKRLKDLALEFRNDFDSSIIPSGHQYAASRATRLFSRPKAIDEIWNGISQLFTARRLVAGGPKKLAADFERLRSTLVSAGMVLNVTAEKAGLARALDCLAAFGAPAEPCRTDDAAFFKLTECADFQPDGTATEIFTAATQVGFAAVGIAAHGIAGPEAVYEKILGHWLSNSLLWEEIRTAGGAYGAFSYPDSLEKVFILASYRDPAPEKSIEAFIRCLERASQTLLDEAALEKAITGSYSREVQPRSPANRGFTGFIRALYGITDGQRARNMRLLLDARPEDIQAAARFLLSGAEKARRALITGKKECGRRAVDLGKI